MIHISALTYVVIYPPLSRGFKKEKLVQVLEHQQRKVSKVILHPDFRQREVTWQSQWDGVG